MHRNSTVKFVSNIAGLLAVVLLVGLALSGVGHAATSRAMPLVYSETTFGDATRTWSTLAAWEDRTDVNCVTGATGYVLTCYPDSASYDQYIALAGATTDTSYFRVIRAAAGHERQASFTGSSGNYTFYVNEANSGVYDLSISSTATGSTYLAGIQIALSGCRVVGCDVGPFTNATTINTGIYNSSTVAYLVNNYIHGVSTTVSTSSAITSQGAGKVIYAYNNTIDTALTGLLGRTSGVINGTNNIVRNVTTTTSGTVNSTTSLLTTGAGNVTFGAVPYLSAVDTAAKDQGTDLSADGVFPFNDAYDGNARPSGAAWDIGCDEYQVTTGGPMIFFFQ